MHQGAPEKNIKKQQKNHFGVDCIFMFSSGTRLPFVLCRFSCGTNHPLQNLMHKFIQEQETIYSMKSL
jgi:hypothetical protein